MNLPSVRGYLGLAELSGNVLDHTSLVLALETLGAIDLRSTLSSVKSDTLIVHGSEDMITPVGAAHFLKENMPNASLNVIPNAGHAPHLSMPDEFNRAIGNFFFC
jgi:pimeloyl-[acyl-carrier protein] methyl ester esterase